MGNPKFRLSDMIPNAWFYKLRDMGKNKNSHTSKKKPPSLSTTVSQKPLFSQPKQPYYYYTWESPKTHPKIQSPPRSFRVSDIDNLFPDLPRRSSKRRSRRKTIYKPSPRRTATSSAVAPPLQDSFDQSSSDSSFDINFLVRCPSPEFDTDNVDPSELLKGLGSESSSCSCDFSSSAADIIIDVKLKSFAKSIDKTDAFDTIPVLDLPPILTKPTKSNHIPDEKAANFSISPQLQEIETLASQSIKIVKEETSRTRKGAKSSKRAARKSASPPSRVKIRTNSPRLASKKTQGQERRSISRNKQSLNSSKKKEGISESFAVVKASADPEKDFRESMMEMVVENNIRASKDLENLLACYLTLNSNEYHQLIVKAFEQIWFNIPDLHL